MGLIGIKSRKRWRAFGKSSVEKDTKESSHKGRLDVTMSTYNSIDVKSLDAKSLDASVQSNTSNLSMDDDDNDDASSCCSSESCSSSSSSSINDQLDIDTSASFDSTGEFLHKDYYHTSPSPSSVDGSLSSETVTGPLDHPQKEDMKRHRRHTTGWCAMVGGAVGTLVFPVVGTVVGGMITGFVANKSLKRKERKIFQKWERDSFQRAASASATANAVFC